MGGTQAGKVMRIVTEQKQKKAGIEVDAAQLDLIEGMVKQKLDNESTALFGTARLWDDGLIDPRDTRKILLFVFEICRHGRTRSPKPSTFGMARM